MRYSHPLQRSVLILVLSLLLSSLSCRNLIRMTPTPMPGQPTEETPMPTLKADKGEWKGKCRALLDDLNELKANLDFPRHFHDGDEMPAAGDFDANDYFKVFTHLRMRDGFVLDYLYHMDGLGGFPLLYAREIAREPLTSQDQLDGEPEKRNGTKMQVQDDYLRYIELDGSEESYLEMALFTRFAGQFYLFWHANYSDGQLVCDSSDLEAVEDELEAYDLDLPLDVVVRSKLIDTTPVVRVSDDVVSVRFVYFTKWGGFIESTYKLDKANGAVLDVQNNTLVDYECGIMY